MTCPSAAKLGIGCLFALSGAQSACVGVTDAAGAYAGRRYGLVSVTPWCSALPAARTCTSSIA